VDPPQIRRLPGGRLHLQHGPIDIVLHAWGAPHHVAAAEGAAIARFATILPELVAELAELRKPMTEAPRLTGAVARRMRTACAPFAPLFITPMAAVAGAVADELLAAMRAAAPLARAYVNDGGDIALHIAPGESLAIGMAADPTHPAFDASLRLTAAHGIGGVATSGRHGRSFSLGIADAVTVLARDAASADAAATLIANAVDTPDVPVRRVPANTLDPDSDLGAIPVTTEVGPLTPSQIDAALANGAQRAEVYRHASHIRAAALRLGGALRLVGAQELLPRTPGAE